MNLYIAVTPDEYELPIYISETASEMARAFGVSPNNIRSSVSHDISGKRLGRKFIKIEVDEGEADD